VKPKIKFDLFIWIYWLFKYVWGYGC